MDNLITLTPLRPEDAAEMFPLLQSPQTHDFISAKPPATEAELRKKYERQAKGHSPDGTELWFNWIVRDTSGKALGFVQASNPKGSNRVMIGYLLHPTSWGKGIAQEALRQMMTILQKDYGITYFWASIDPRNTRSVSLVQRLGYQATKDHAPQVEGDLVFEFSL